MGERNAAVLPSAGLVLLAALLVSVSLARNVLWQDPIALWEDSLTRSPEKARVNYQLGRLYGDAGRSDEAFARMGRAKQLDPAFFDKHLSRAESYRRQGMLREAAEEYRKQLEQDPLQPVVRNDLGTVLHGQGMLVEAFLEFSEAVRIDAAYAMAYANRGVVNMEWNAVDDAITDYRRAIELQPDSASFHAKLGYAYLKKGRPGDALAEYDRALALDPQNAQALRERPHAYSRWKAGGNVMPGHGAR